MSKFQVGDTVASLQDAYEFQIHTVTDHYYYYTVIPPAGLNDEPYEGIMNIPEWDRQDRYYVKTLMSTVPDYIYDKYEVNDV